MNNLFKIISVILFYFLGRMAIAAETCEVYKSLRESHEVCWSIDHKAWITKKCLDKKSKCDAMKFLTGPKVKVTLPKLDSQNPAAMYCHALKHKVDIYRDGLENEQSFCIFKDKTMIDVNAVERLAQ